MFDHRDHISLIIKHRKHAYIPDLAINGICTLKLPYFTGIEYLPWWGSVYRVFRGS